MTGMRKGRVIQVREERQRGNVDKESNKMPRRRLCKFGVGNGKVVPGRTSGGSGCSEASVHPEWASEASEARALEASE